MKNGAEPGVTWVDLFPWIPRPDGLGDLRAEYDWSAPVDMQDPSTNPRCAVVSEMALDRLAKHWTISEIFPLLPGETSIRDIGLGNRSYNHLNKSGLSRLEELGDMELRELLDIRSLGLGTVGDIVHTLVRASIELVARPPAYEIRRGLGGTSLALASAQTAWVQTAGLALTSIAQWNVLVGRPDSSLVALPSELLHDPDEAGVLRALVGLSAADVLPASELEYTVARLLAGVLSVYDDRAQRVLRQRFFADTRATLDSLGSELGVTRERVRQIESRLRSELSLELAEGGSLFAIGSAVRALIGTIRPLDELLLEIPALADEVALVGQPCWRVIDRIDDEYEIVDGWCCAPSLTTVVQLTLSRLDEYADDYGVVELAENPDWYPGTEESAGSIQVRGLWLEYLGIPLYRGRAITRSAGITDWLAAILSIEKRSMALDELVEALPLKRSVGAIKNALGSDDRFSRVDRSRWALSEWGLNEYLGIRELIRAEIAESGGALAVESLVARISGSYDVNAASVRTYAANPPFVIENGKVSESSSGSKRRHRSTISSTRLLYQVGDSLRLRVRVTSDHLRGSGFPLPVALATSFGLEAGLTLAFETERGPILMRWSGNQPTMSSIRAFLVDLDCEIGDEVFCSYGMDRSFAVTRVLVREDFEPLEQVAALIGCELTGHALDDLSTLAVAVGQPENSSLATVVGGLQDRGESEFADVLMASHEQFDAPARGSTGPAPNVDDIMELL